jgi:hypothetical protein
MAGFFSRTIGKLASASSVSASKVGAKEASVLRSIGGYDMLGMVGGMGIGTSYGYIQDQSFGERTGSAALGGILGGALGAGFGLLRGRGLRNTTLRANQPLRK